MTSRLRNPSRGAFTLVELITVMAIIVVLTALVVPAFNSISTGWQLTGSADTVVDGLRAARQQALSRSRQMEFRFYDIPPASGGGTAAYQAYSYFSISDSGSAGSALDKVNYLPTGMALASATTYSSIFSLTGTTDSSGRKYIPFRFMPDGSTNLPIGQGNWFVTVLPSRLASGTGLPANYITIEINPINGSVTLFRP